MKKTLIAGIVGGVILFIWGAVDWTVLPLHEKSLHAMANEDSVIAVMRPAMNAKAVYVFPAMPKSGPDASAQQKELATNTWIQKMQRGPVGMVIYDPNGTNPMMPLQLLVGLINCFVMASLAAWLLQRSTASSSFIARVTFCVILGVFASLVTHVTNWNWMGYPGDYTTGMIFDVLVGWVLAGIGIAVVVKSPRAA